MNYMVFDLCDFCLEEKMVKERATSLFGERVVLDRICRACEDKKTPPKVFTESLADA